MKRITMNGLALLAVAAMFALVATAAEGALPSGGSYGATPAKKAPKPKEYELNEDGTWYPGDNLQLFKKTHTWDFAGTGEEGIYSTNGKNIELTEYSERCIFVGSKGKHGIAYVGTYECEAGAFGGTWEVRKLP